MNFWNMSQRSNDRDMAESNSPEKTTRRNLLKGGGVALAGLTGLSSFTNTAAATSDSSNSGTVIGSADWCDYRACTKTKIVFTKCKRNPWKSEIVKNRSEELVDYLNENISEPRYHEFTFEDYGNCGIKMPDINHTENKKEEKIEEIVEKVDEDLDLDDGDVVAIAHGKWGWGYGQAWPFNEDIQINDKDLTGALICANRSPGPHDWEVRGFTWHEIAHGFGAKHWHGSIALDENDRMHKITPMCMSYVDSKNGKHDTRFGADHDSLNEFQRYDSEDNLKYSSDYKYKYDNTWWGVNKEKLHDLNRLSDKTLEQIESHAKKYR